MEGRQRLSPSCSPGLLSCGLSRVKAKSSTLGCTQRGYMLQRGPWDDTVSSALHWQSWTIPLLFLWDQGSGPRLWGWLSHQAPWMEPLNDQLQLSASTRTTWGGKQWQHSDGGASPTPTESRERAWSQRVVCLSAFCSKVQIRMNWDIWTLLSSSGATWVLSEWVDIEPGSLLIPQIVQYFTKGLFPSSQTFVLCVCLAVGCWTPLLFGNNDAEAEFKKHTDFLSKHLYTHSFILLTSSWTS